MIPHQMLLSFLDKHSDLVKLTEEWVIIDKDMFSYSSIGSKKLKKKGPPNLNQKYSVFLVGK